MDVQIADYCSTPDRDRSIAQVLMTVFIDEGYADRDAAPRLTSPREVMARGSVIIAHPVGHDDQLLGMVIFAPPTGSARQIARAEEGEVQLLAVLPIARGHRIATRLMIACEEKAKVAGFAHMVLSTQPTMVSAHRVYERLGYVRNPERDWQRSNGRSFLVYEKSFSTT